MTFPYIDGYSPMIEMFPIHGGSLTIDSGITEDDHPVVIINDQPLDEDEVMVLVRHLLVNLEHARHMYFERHNRLEPKPLVEGDAE
ncbi:hypothetical protein [Leucobacter denitrificans]|uniref:Uncharacterized protein n=1 Tax=Leucobacter denitrificans TaxID=683042 RepID=A0A7G9S3D0_9MICO|nr:hypothetical protein [Leucobacter denitrificans]QNN62355.1 hypothetical protein H9L06_08800 [Leucobacter denitrificans]